MKVDIKARKEFIASSGSQLDALAAVRDKKLGAIGNIVPDDRGIPITDNEDFNTIQSEWGHFKTNEVRCETQDKERKYMYTHTHVLTSVFISLSLHS